MTGRAEHLLGPEARARVAAAIARAERGTSGEIVVMLSARSGAYRSAAPLAALAAALALAWLLVAVTDWSTARILLTQAGVAAAIMTLGLFERLRLALVPAPMRRSRAREAAQRAFRCQGMTRTRGRTGVLVHVSLAEHHAEIVTDIGILRHMGQEAWQGILSGLLLALARGEAEAGLVAAVERIGALLASEFPAGPADMDELPNRVIISE